MEKSRMISKPIDTNMYLSSKRIREDSDDSGVVDQPPKKLHPNRHTEHQVHEMQEFFKKCSHPSSIQRDELSFKLGLEPLQIKYWFQNKRNQQKMQHELQENMDLRIMNIKLKEENAKCKEDFCNVACVVCGGPLVHGRKITFEGYQLLLENAYLKEEIVRMFATINGTI